MIKAYLVYVPRTNSIVLLYEDLIVYLELLYVLIDHYSYVKNKKRQIQSDLSDSRKTENIFFN